MRINKIVILEKTNYEEFSTEQLKLITDELDLYSDSQRINQEILNKAKGTDSILISWSTNIDDKKLKNLYELKHISMCCDLKNNDLENIEFPVNNQNLITIKGLTDYGDQVVVQYSKKENVDRKL